LTDRARFAHDAPVDIRRHSSRTVYENAWMRVREDEIERPDGSRGIYGVVEKPDFALVIPQDRDGGLWVIEQYRYPVSGRYWEFPQGAWETQEAVDPAELARGELEEETGLRAGSLAHLGHLFQAYGYSSQGFDVWLATDLSAGELNRAATEQDMRHRKVSRDEWEQMLATGTVKDAGSIAAYGLLLLSEHGT
jgi:ADP-ribose pyrophosphatase